MADELNSAENNVAELAEQSQAEEVDFTDTSEDVDAKETEAGESESSSDTSVQTEQPAKAKQSAEENAEYARKRRKAEEEKRLKETQDTTRLQTIIDITGGKNPYTDEPITDSHDAEEYLLMKRIEKEGGDPIADYAKAKVRADRERAQKAKAEREAQDKMNADFADFEAKYPDVDPSKLVADTAFADYAEGKVGKKPLADIYAGYLKLTGNASEQGKREVAQQVANAKASPGATASQGQSANFYSIEKVKKMTEKEIHDHWDEIMASKSKW